MLPKHPWLKKCLEYLEKLPQIYATATTEPYIYENKLADGKLSIQTIDNKIDYIFVIKSEIRADTVDVLFEYLHHFSNYLEASDRPLLITNDLEDFVIEQLLERNVEFLDTTGTIYLNNSNFYVLVRNSVPQIHKASSSNNVSTTTLKLIFTLLKSPEYLQKSDYHYLAELTEMEPEAVLQALESLYHLGYLRRLSNDKYLIADYNKLFERWQFGYMESLRPSLFINTYRPLKQKAFSEIQKHLIEVSTLNNILIGGELGAAILTKKLRPIGTVLHIPKEQNYRKLMVDLHLVPDPQGTITFLYQFSQNNYYSLDQGLTLIADPLLLYTELMRVPDDRLKETAQRLYKKYMIERDRQSRILGILANTKIVSNYD